MTARKRTGKGPKDRTADVPAASKRAGARGGSAKGGGAGASAGKKSRKLAPIPAKEPAKADAARPAKARAAGTGKDSPPEGSLRVAGGKYIGGVAVGAEGNVHPMPKAPAGNGGAGANGGPGSTGGGGVGPGASGGGSGAARAAVQSHSSTGVVTARPVAKVSPPGPPFTVFLDRDGVFNVNPRLAVFRRNGFRWLTGAKEAFARLNRPGIQTCLATNQPLLGTFTFGLLARRVNRALQEHLAEAGGRLDRVEAALAPPLARAAARIMPRAVRRRIARRKPGPGMLEDGGVALGVDRRRAVMVGDKAKDCEAATRYGIACILLATTHTEEELRRRCLRRGLSPMAIVPGLPEAVPIILAMAEAG